MKTITNSNRFTKGTVGVFTGIVVVTFGGEDTKGIEG
jgi:hypothetical protein